MVELLGLGKREPPITDLPFLSYTYKLLAEASRRFDPRSALTLGSVGDRGLDAWQNAAKSLSSRNARLELWSELFVAAMRQDCWEDVRFVGISKQFNDTSHCLQSTGSCSSEQGGSRGEEGHILFLHTCQPVVCGAQGQN